MKILHLEVSDLKRISAIEIDPVTGKPIVLTGDNANGKSSVLEAIILALANTGLDDPIRHGRPSGSVKLTLGAEKAEYLLERKITKTGQKLTLTDAEGRAVARPQTFLDGLVGNYAFDPLEFTKLKTKEQVEALKAAAGLDFTDIDAKRAELYAERTIVTRDWKEAASLLEGMTPPEEGIPTEEVSASELMTNLRALEDAGANAGRANANAVACTESHASALQDVARAEAVLASAKELAEKREKEKMEAFDAMDAANEAAPTAEELTAARQAIEQVDKTNAAVRNAIAYKEKSAKAEDLRLKFANLKRRIEEIDEEKMEAIKNANLPLDGLELTDDGVMVNGTFFNQLSTAEQIRVSTLVAMSQNPGLRIVIIREGALMNSANLKMISDLAADSGYQLWIEKFQEKPSDVGFHIVDGAIAFEDGVEVAS